MLVFQSLSLRLLPRRCLEVPAQWNRVSILELGILQGFPSLFQGSSGNVEWEA